MTKNPLNGVLQRLRTVAALQAYRKMADSELLERFVGSRDEAAFSVLIERHGPMVVGVCRRALPSFHDAEDACQATFLVLARKAASVRKKTSLSSWLHGVACRAVARLKRDHARRTNRERGVAAPVQWDPAAEVSWREVQAILDEELQALPERFRAPMILCYLECMTRDEAAQQLGLSLGTLHGQLERARNALRERLAKRGLTLAAALSAAALGEGVAQAALAPTFAVSSTKAALSLAAGKPLAECVVATHVLALTREVLNAMLWTKLKVGAAAAVCAVLLVALLGGSFASLSSAQDAKSDPKAAFDRYTVLVGKEESDADFIRRISKDLRGIDPTPAEMHFFLVNKDAGRRQKLIDLFIQERQANQKADHLKLLTEKQNKALDWLKKQQQYEEVTQGMERIAERVELEYAKKKAGKLKELDERIRKAREELEKLLKEADQQKPRTAIDDLIEAAIARERIEKEQEEEKAKQVAPAPPPLPNPVDGVIEKIDPKDASLVLISIGSDVGLAKNHTLGVYRLKPTPMYLGKIQIVEMTPHKCVARRVGPVTARTPALMPGDIVSSSLTTPPEEKNDQRGPSEPGTTVVKSTLRIDGHK